MIHLHVTGAPPLKPGERRLVEHLDAHPCVVVTGISLRSGGRAREFDAIVIARFGVFTVEVKSTPAHGVLHAPDGDAWDVSGETDLWAGGSSSRPGSQADLQRKILASRLHDEQVEAGYIAAVVAIDGDAVRLAPAPVDHGHKPVPGAPPLQLVSGSVRVIKSDRNAFQALAATRGSHANDPSRQISAERVRDILIAIGMTRSAPDLDAIVELGFPPQAELASAVAASAAARDRRRLARESAPNTPEFTEMLERVARRAEIEAETEAAHRRHEETDTFEAKDRPLRERLIEQAREQGRARVERREFLAARWDRRVARWQSWRELHDQPTAKRLPDAMALVGTGVLSLTVALAPYSPAFLAAAAVEFVLAVALTILAPSKITRNALSLVTASSLIFAALFYYLPTPGGSLFIDDSLVDNVLWWVIGALISVAVSLTWTMLSPVGLPQHLMMTVIPGASLTYAAIPLSHEDPTGIAGLVVIASTCFALVPVYGLPVSDTYQWLQVPTGARPVARIARACALLVIVASAAISLSFSQGQPAFVIAGLLVAAVLAVLADDLSSAADEEAAYREREARDEAVLAAANPARTATVAASTSAEEPTPSAITDRRLASTATERN